MPRPMVASFPEHADDASPRRSDSEKFPEKHGEAIDKRPRNILHLVGFVVSLTMCGTCRTLGAHRWELARTGRRDLTPRDRPMACRVVFPGWWSDGGRSQVEGLDLMRPGRKEADEGGERRGQTAPPSGISPRSFGPRRSPAGWLATAWADRGGGPRTGPGPRPNHEQGRFAATPGPPDSV